MRTALAQSVAPAAADAPAVATPSRWEVRFTSGALIATGNQRNYLKDADMSSAQLSWLVRPSIALTGTFGWARSRDLHNADRPKLDVLTSDVGAEYRPAQWFADRAVSFSPFVGAGAGMRSYNYRSLDENARHNVAGYVSAGGELGVARVGVRLEVRDYATGFKPLVGAGTTTARNDVVVAVGLRLKKRPLTQR
jgi:hypothetical protein